MQDEGNVRGECLAPRVVLRHGCASAAVSTAAYNAAQRLLAVAFADGRIQLFGGICEEYTLASDCRTATTALHFLRDKPFLLRVSSQNEVELWNLRSLALQSSTLWAGEITATCPLPHAPAFVLVGEEDGGVRAARFSNSGTVEACAYELAPQQLTATAEDGGARVVALVLQPGAEDGRLLVAHTCGAVTLVDIPSREVVARIGSGDGRLTSATWLDGLSLVTGHSHGALRLWSLPDAAAPSRAVPGATASGVLVSELRLGDSDVLLLNTAVSGGSESDSVFAQCGDRAFYVRTTRTADGLTTMVTALVELPALEGGLRALVHGDVRLLVGLSAGDADTGILFAHGMEPEGLWLPVPLGFPVASLTCAQVMAQAGAVLEALRRAAPVEADDSTNLLATLGDAPSLGAARLLITGHADGTVRFLDASNAGLPLLAVLAAGDGPVTSVTACLNSALCAVCTADRISVVAFDGTPFRCGDAALEAPPLCVSLCTTAGVVAVGMAHGEVVFLQLPEVTTSTNLQAFSPEEAVVDMVTVDGAEAGPLFLAFGSAASIAIASCTATHQLLSTVKPKTPSPGVALFALDEAGAPIVCHGAPLPGHPRQPLPPMLDDDDPCPRGGRAATVISCSEHAARVYLLTSLLRGTRHAECKHEFRVPLAHATVIVAPGGACIACLDRALTLHVLEAALLSPVTRVAVPDLMGTAWTGDAATLFAAGLDGHVVSVWTDSRGEVMSEFVRLELLEEFSAPEPPPEPPSFWQTGRVAKTAEQDSGDAEAVEAAEPDSVDSGPGRRSVFGGKLAGIRANMARHAKNALQRVGAPGFKTRKVLSADDMEDVFPRLTQSAPALAPTPVTRTRLVVDGAATSDPSRERSDLFGVEGGCGGGSGKLRSVDDIRARYGRPARPVDCAATMGENLQKLNERGEKLSNIQEKTARLEQSASDFAASAKKLREQQEAGSFFGLFK